MRPSAWTRYVKIAVMAGFLTPLIPVWSLGVKSPGFDPAPVPGGSIIRGTEHDANDSVFRIDRSDPFFTCEEQGWVMAQSYGTLDFDNSSSAAFVLSFVGRSAGLYGIALAYTAPFCGLFAPICAAGVTAGVATTAALSTISDLGNNHQERAGYYVLPIAPFWLLRDVTDNIVFNSLVRDQIRVPTMTNFVGILQNRNTAADSFDGMGRPVSNSAHSLCHLIRCARDINQLSSQAEKDALLQQVVNDNPETDPSHWILKPNTGNPYSDGQYRICRIFQDVTKQRADSYYVQDLKNYLALERLQRNQYIAKRRLEPTPFLDLTTFRALSHQMLGAVNEKIEANFDEAFFSRYFLNLSRQKQSKIVLGDRLRNRCSRVEAKLCTPVNLFFNEWSLLPNGTTVQGQSVYELIYPLDLMASTLFQDSRFANGYMQFMAQASLDNLIDIAPVTLMRPENIYIRGSQDKDVSRLAFKEGGANHLQAKYQLTAALSQVQESLQRMYVQRMPWLTNDDPNVSFDTRQSQLGLLEQESTRRLYDQKWLEMMSVASDVTVVREMVSMMALQLMVKHQLSDHVARTEALMAANVTLQFKHILGAMEQGEQQSATLQ